MKKILLSAVALMAAMTINAQEVCTLNADNALGLDADNGTALTAGTVIGETASIVATVGADDTYKPQSVKATVTGGEINGGLQGNSNPKDADGGTPSSSLIAPASGAFLQFEAKADGFLYVIHKASSNKAYTVFEEGTAIGYTFAAIGDASTDLGAVYQFTLKGEGELNELKNPVEWAEQEFLKATDPDKYAAHWTNDGEKDTWTKIAKGGIGVIAFPVYKDCKYIVNANGSKITAGGFVFSTEDNVAIVSDDVTIYTGSGAAPIEVKVYSVIGTIEGNWDSDKDMTKGSDGIYTAVFENVKAGNYEFKIRVNHDWAENFGVDGAQGGANLTVSVPTDGSTITIKFDLSTKTITATVSEASGISTIKNVINVNDVIFNAAGQKVDKNYKGIVIKNGKKIIQ